MAIVDKIIKGGNGISFTKECDSSADWINIAKNTYFRDIATDTIYYKNSSGTIRGLLDGIIYGSANNRAVENNILYRNTTDAATAVELTTDGAAGSGATNRISVPLNTTMSCVVNISVKQESAVGSKQMLRQFVITNNAGTTAIEGTVIALGTDSGSASLATVTCTITANNTDDCIKVEVNGLVGTNLRYTAFIVSTETYYVTVI